jgi:uncharacterized protein (DUF111 family)
MLAPDLITSSEIELGGGTVTCAHGVLPVPAPATQLLVRGLPVKTGGFNREMTTPTGAAILAASVDRFIVTGEGSGIFRDITTGTGIGTRKMDKPNILRVSLRESAEGAGGEIPEPLVLLEANIDDMTGEALGFLMERFFDTGALDAVFVPVTMKKSRPGTLVSVLARPEKSGALRDCFFRYSSTIGLREIPVNRFCLRRGERIMRGGFGEAREKLVFQDGEKPFRSKIEFEDRARVARERRVPLDQAERIIREESDGQ